MKFERYRHWNQLPPSVDSLFNLAGNESMFLTREWFETLYAKTFKEGQSLLLASVQDKGNVVALLPLTGADERWQSFNHRYTALYSLLVVEENQAEILSCLAKGLSQIPVHSLQLNPVAEDDSNLLHLQQVIKASIFRLAYDEAWKRYSPGSILTAYLMQYVIDIDKVEEIGFLTGNEAYKQDWMSERRQRWRLVLVKPQKTQTKNIFRSAINIILR